MTLDLAMPGRDGMSVLRELRATGSTTRAVVVSAFSPASGARAVDALAEGAFELVAKPATGSAFGDFAIELCSKMEAAGRAGARGAGPARSGASFRPTVVRGRSATARFVVIASSTGGPRALNELVPQLPAPLGLGGVIVQHMPANFTASLAQRLDKASALNVLEADGTQRTAPGTLLLAPGGHHLRLESGGRTSLSDEAPIGGLRPRADLTIADAARLYRNRLVLVVLTGMGRDGAEAAQSVRQYGGRILVEAESTCTVYGMPRAIAEAGLADAVLPLHELAAAVAAEAGA